jgi:hypothetical protein
MAAIPKADEDAPVLDQGETTPKPNPAPRASMISETEAATKAPTTTAPHDTPDECSLLPVSIRLSNTKVFSI